MALSHLLAPNNPNYGNLAIFICHLFIDGQFRTGHIIHDPKASSAAQLITEIQSICPHFIPWLSTDVTEPSRLPWKPDEQTDHILQLIFLDPDNLPKNVVDFKKFFTFYRLFVFPLNDKSSITSTSSEINAEHINAVNKMTLAFDLNSLASLHISENGSVCIHWAIEGYNSIHSMCQHEEKCHSDHNNLFEATFGAIENSLIAIDHLITFPCDDNASIRRLYRNGHGNLFFANYFYSHLDASFINLTISSCKHSTTFSNAVHPKSQRFYKELTQEHESIENEKISKLKKNDAKIYHLDTHSILSVKSTKDTNALYPYQSYELKVVFVYGADVKRQKYQILLTECGEEVFYLVGAFMLLAAAVICFIRRKLRLRRDGLNSALIDVLIAFFAGGNLRIRNKFERWIFGILLIGSFFLMTFWLEAVLFPSFLIHDQSIKTFDQLAKLNTPIYIYKFLQDDTKIITEILRRKMRQHPNIEGYQLLEELIQEHTDSFAFVSKSTSIYHVKLMLQGRRDFDIIQENLGSVSAAFTLKTNENEHVPRRLIQKINKATLSIMEMDFTIFTGLLHIFWKNFT